MPKYQLPDEPRPGALSQAVVEPMWPLLASMLGGTWLGWPWFVLNAHAVGSPTRWRQTLLIAGGFAGSFAILFAIIAMRPGPLADRVPLKLALLGLVVFKLLVSYVVFVMQAPSIELFSYYRGVVRNGLPVVVAGWFLESRVIGALPDFLAVVLR